jgi:hypothetical protein
MYQAVSLLKVMEKQAINRVRTIKLRWLTHSDWKGVEKSTLEVQG